MAGLGDFDGDRVPDLLVGANYEGTLWSSDETRRVLPRFADPNGRAERYSKTPIRDLRTAFTEYTPQHGFGKTVASARGEEPEGANTLF